MTSLRRRALWLMAAGVVETALLGLFAYKLAVAPLASGRDQIIVLLLLGLCILFGLACIAGSADMMVIGRIRPAARIIAGLVGVVMIGALLTAWLFL